jgi:hypothetical protein
MLALETLKNTLKPLKTQNNIFMVVHPRLAPPRLRLQTRASGLETKANT